ELARLRIREGDLRRIAVGEVAHARVPLEDVEPHAAGEVARAVPVRVRPDARDRPRSELLRERRWRRLGAVEEDAVEAVGLTVPLAARRERTRGGKRPERE